MSNAEVGSRNAEKGGNESRKTFRFAVHLFRVPTSDFRVPITRRREAPTSIWAAKRRARYTFRSSNKRGAEAQRLGSWGIWSW